MARDLDDVVQKCKTSCRCVKVPITPTPRQNSSFGHWHCDLVLWAFASSMVLRAVLRDIWSEVRHWSLDTGKSVDKWAYRYKLGAGDDKCVWSDQCEQCFNRLQELLRNVIGRPQVIGWAQLFNQFSDACDYCVAGALLQTDTNSKQMPITFHSRVKQKGTERLEHSPQIGNRCVTRSSQIQTLDFRL